ncbi:hypothetical protein EVAR_7836_1 [Eumeta japonica]|uniref:Uncharacterized protein n=1 Tax=Eumeta variegata TaxID=151549 RepID=A0A4C1TUX8_EUMVA|nr:hypothetical protein EVAR_7836_1 [Eumeta japonica]
MALENGRALIHYAVNSVIKARDRPAVGRCVRNLRVSRAHHRPMSWHGRGVRAGRGEREGFTRVPWPRRGRAGRGRDGNIFYKGTNKYAAFEILSYIDDPNARNTARRRVVNRGAARRGSARSFVRPRVSGKNIPTCGLIAHRAPLDRLVHDSENRIQSAVPPKAVTGKKRVDSGARP